MSGEVAEGEETQGGEADTAKAILGRCARGGGGVSGEN
jgi:hypothetical protein